MNSNALEAKPKTITLYDFFNYVLFNVSYLLFNKKKKKKKKKITPPHVR